MRWLIVLLIAGLTGCLQPQKPVWDTVPSTTQLLEQLSATAGRYVSLDGAATVSLTTGERYLSTEQFVLLMTGIAKMHKPLPIDAPGHLFQYLYAACVVLNQIIVSVG